MPDSAERWLPVVGYEGYYEVSDQGRVRSLDRVIIDLGGRRKRPEAGRILSPVMDVRGHYLHVGLWRNGKPTTRPIHLLVIRAFIGPPPADMECLHGPNGKLDNRLSNLSYGTHSQNAQEMQRDGVDFHRNLTHCNYHHELAAPNLIPSQLAKGHRNCLACSRAGANMHYAQRKGRPFEFRVKADEHYRKIMNIPLRGSAHPSVE
jgi:NUMOD4 motif/HNH endonuclease